MILLESILQILSSAGNFLCGISAFCGIFYIKKELQKYKDQKKIEAASVILAEISKFINKTIDITDNRSLYMYKSHGNETASHEGNEKYYKERPSRLIYRKYFKELKENTYSLIAWLAKCEKEKILKLLKELDAYSYKLCHAIFINLENHKDLQNLENQKMLGTYEEDLNAIQKKANEILEPIIES